MALGAVTASAAFVGTASGHSGVDPARGSHSPREGSLFYVNESGSAILRRALASGRTSTVAAGLKGPTGIVKVGDRLFWDQQAGYACSSDPNDDQIIALTSPSQHPKIVRNCVPSAGGTGLVATRRHLYLVQQHGIGRMNLRGGHFDRRDIPLSNQLDGSAANGLASDGRYLYFSRCDGDEIGRVARDGTGLNYDFIRTGHKTCPQALAVGGGHLYWTQGGVIGRARLDGSHIRRNWQSIHNGNGPFFLAANAHHVYWDWGGDAGTPSFVGRVTVTRQHFAKRWRRGQGAFLLVSPAAN